MTFLVIRARIITASLPWVAMDLRSQLLEQADRERVKGVIIRPTGLNCGFVLRMVVVSQLFGTP
jgi:hypothetical protein